MPNLKHKYPIAETFTSIQGEGVYCGTPMHFIRLAGCNVGVYPKREASSGDPFPLYSKCTSVLGAEFECDTNYRTQTYLTVEELLGEIPSAIQHICITGGEPFLHDLEPLIANCDRTIHIETSGTKLIPQEESLSNIWITCSPKAGFLRTNGLSVNEWKFVVSGPADIPKIEQFFEGLVCFADAPVFLQPINCTNEVDPANLQMVRELVMQHPCFRLSAQLHKFLGVR
jgi:7-carboxy-7-deazaguanine synthase